MAIFKYEFDGFTMLSDNPDLKFTEVPTDYYYDADLEDEIPIYEKVYPISCTELSFEEAKKLIK